MYSKFTGYIEYLHTNMYLYIFLSRPAQRESKHHARGKQVGNHHPRLSVLRLFRREGRGFSGSKITTQSKLNFARKEEKGGAPCRENSMFLQVCQGYFPGRNPGCAERLSSLSPRPSFPTFSLAFPPRASKCGGHDRSYSSSPSHETSVTVLFSIPL
jgi:hypothetical protein